MDNSLMDMMSNRARDQAGGYSGELALLTSLNERPTTAPTTAATTTTTSASSSAATLTISPSLYPKQEEKEPVIMLATATNNNSISMMNRRSAVVRIRYRECQKNHAASIGGNATDGCGEFMPGGGGGGGGGGEGGTLDALKCSACSCHRNFHRKELLLDWYCYQCSQSPSQCRPDCPSSSLHDYCCLSGKPLLPSLKQPSHAPLPLLFVDNNYKAGTVPLNFIDAEKVKKRFRTKFTQEQKERMLAFADKAGWKIRKLGDLMVQQFCKEVGIKRRVLKVWLHNNKHTFANKTSSSAST